jgi:hypothetical protein
LPYFRFDRKQVKILFMKLHRLTVLAVIPFVLLFSCTVQKRVYRPGYHVEWKSRQVSESKPQSPNEQLLSETAPAEKEQETALLEPKKATLTHDVPVVTENSINTTHPVAAEQTRIPEVKQERSPFQAVKQLPKAVKSAHDKTVSHLQKKQFESRRIFGLILAPLRFLFTLLFIVLVCAGLVLLFVLESSLGGTVLLAAGAVFLILLIL